MAWVESGTAPLVEPDLSDVGETGGVVSEGGSAEELASAGVVEMLSLKGGVGADVVDGARACET